MKEMITSRQMIALMTLTRLSIALSRMPTTNIRPFNQDVWIMVLVSIIYTYLAMIPLLYLAKKFRDVRMIGYLDIIHGKAIGKILAFLYGLYFLFTSILAATIQSELITTSILADTSENLIVIAMIATSVYCVSRGVMTGIRAIEVLSPIAITIVLILMVFGVNNFKYDLLLPILSDSTILDINLGAMELTAYYQEIFFLTMLVPYLENKSDINKIFVKSAIYSLGLLAVIVIICYITFGVEYIQHSNFPFLLYARSIDLMEVVERIDSVAVVAWIIASSIRISAYLAISVITIREIFNKDETDKKILVILSSILFLVTLYVVNTRSVIIAVEDILRLTCALSFIFTIVVPSITCVVYFIRRKSIESNTPNN